MERPEIIPDNVDDYLEAKHDDLLENWVAENHFVDTDNYEINHVVFCLKAIMKALFEKGYCEDFCHAVIMNRFDHVCMFADDINLRFLKVYMLFLKNCVPMEAIYNYQKKNKRRK